LTTRSIPSRTPKKRTPAIAATAIVWVPTDSTGDPEKALQNAWESKPGCANRSVSAWNA
jgi:hypothetical protein